MCHCATLICPARRRSRAEGFPRRPRAPCASGPGKVSTICRGIHLVVRFPFTYAVAAAQRALSTAIQNLAGGKHVLFKEITVGYTSPPIFRIQSHFWEATCKIHATRLSHSSTPEKSTRRGYHLWRASRTLANHGELPDRFLSDSQASTRLPKNKERRDTGRSQNLSSSRTNGPHLTTSSRSRSVVSHTAHCRHSFGSALNHHGHAESHRQILRSQQDFL